MTDSSVAGRPRGAARTLEGSPDGLTLASGDDAGSVRLWDLKTGESCALEPRHHGGVSYLSFSPDGRTLASTAARSPGEIYLWDVPARGFLGRVLHAGPAHPRRLVHA